MSHIKDLRRMAEERGYATTSAFLSEEERAKFLQSIKGERGASYFLLPEKGERQLCVFYPSFMTEEECRTSLSGENAPFSILEIRGKQEKFAEKLSHRDILGAVMNLGITREQVGDILFQESVSYLFLLRKMKGRRKNIRPWPWKVPLYRGGEEYQEGTDCSGDFEVCLMMD